MKRFILSIILLIVIIGVGQLLMHIAPTQDQQPSEPTQAPTPAEHLITQPNTTTGTTADTITTNTITPTPIPTDTTDIVTK